MLLVSTLNKAGQLQLGCRLAGEVTPELRALNEGEQIDFPKHRALHDLFILELEVCAFLRVDLVAGPLALYQAFSSTAEQSTKA